MDALQREQFQEMIWQYYGAHGRHDLPWRQPEPNGEFDAYKIMVSELMLQQTQVPRVIPKFTSFVKQFPSVQQLAAAPLASVLQAWSGLGYNRRAKFLRQAARQVTEQYGGKLPLIVQELVKLPGIGPNTAGAIVAYGANQPVVFLETNIRTVFIHHFFEDHPDKVTEKQIAALASEVLPHTDIREWYWALMDYGTFLKQTIGNASRRSAVYAKQSKFEGSRRQLRGQVLRQLGESAQTLTALQRHIVDERLAGVLEDLTREGFIYVQNATYHLGSA